MTFPVLELLRSSPENHRDEFGDYDRYQGCNRRRRLTRCSIVRKTRPHRYGAGAPACTWASAIILPRSAEGLAARALEQVALNAGIYVSAHGQGLGASKLRALPGSLSPFLGCTLVILPPMLAC